MRRAIRATIERARDASGAVYVEFLIAFLPLLCLFSALVQLAMVQIASLVTNHAAVSAARAAMVVLPDNRDPEGYGAKLNEIGGGRLDAIVAAANMALAAIDSSPHASVQFLDARGTNNAIHSVGPHDLLHAQVTYGYPCTVPIGAHFVCGLSGTKTLLAEASMPNQGAEEP
jgi:hypothetical protein